MLQVVAKLPYPLNAPTQQQNGNVFNGMMHHKLWKIIYISKMLQCEVHSGPI
jgi:hypothetical protein